MSGPSHRPLVTVAVVTLNAAAELPGTLRSIRRQGWAEMEVLVVDGGSTDATLDIVREPGSGVTRWVSGPDRGPYDAMNKAASIAAGDYIIFMNAGDWFADPQAIEHAFRHAPPDADFVIGHHLYRLRDGAMALHQAADFEQTWSRLKAGDFSFGWLSGIPCHQATFTRREMLAANPYDIGFRIAADHDFMFRMRGKGARFHHANSVVAVYSQGGMSTQQEALCFHEWWRIGCAHGEPGAATRFFQENFSPGVIDPPRRVAERVAELRASGLFFEDWYRAQHPRDGMADPAEHYLYLGARQGFAPNPFFDPAYYLSHHPEVAAEGMDPFAHYLREGRERSLPTFDWGDASRPVAAFRAVFDPRREGLDVLVARIARMPADQLARLLAPYAPPPPRRAPDTGDAPADGSWALVEGMSDQAEGPYPQLGLDAPFRWSLGPLTVLRVYSAQEGRRRLRLVLRNLLGDQRLAISCDGRVLPEAKLPVADISVPVPVDLTIDGPAGYREIEIRPSRQSPPDGLGRCLTFILDSVRLDDAAADADRAGAAERVLWDLSDGLAASEGPEPELGLTDPYRWVVARRCRLMLETPAARQATLRIDYRCPVAGQRAILRVNDDPAQFLRLDAGAMSERFRIEVPARLRPGRSTVELLLSEMTLESAGGRELALLIEDVAIL